MYIAQSMPHTERAVCMCETCVHVYMTHLVQLCTSLYRHCTCTSFTCSEHDPLWDKTTRLL